MWKIMSSKILKDISVLPAQHRPLHLASVKFPEYSYLQDIIDIGRGGNEDESGKERIMLGNHKRDTSQKPRPPIQKSKFSPYTSKARALRKAFSSSE